MKAIVTLCGMGVVALAMTACNQAPTPAPDTHDADVKAIQDVEAQDLQGWAAKDADKMAAFYADDAVLMAPGMEAIHGKDAIHAALKQMMADPGVSLTFESSKVDVAKSGDLGYSEGSYKMMMTDPATHKVMNDHGSYVTTFRKQADGSWKAEADIANSAVPPPAPKKH
ncbi:MAG: SgcJ/EcaC family oxidoreductase [Terracidiphilus sp.]